MASNTNTVTLGFVQGVNDGYRDGCAYYWAGVTEGAAQVGRTVDYHQGYSAAFLAAQHPAEQAVSESAQYGKLAGGLVLLRANLPRRAGNIVDWLAVALFGLLLAVFCCFRAAGAAEYTYTAEDVRTGQPVAVLDTRYDCAADRAADAGSRAGIDISWAGRFCFGFYDAERGELLSCHSGDGCALGVHRGNL